MAKTIHNAFHVVCDLPTQRLVCRHCSEWVPMPAGRVDWVADVCAAFTKQHLLCKTGEQHSMAPRCMFAPIPAGELVAARQRFDEIRKELREDIGDDAFGFAEVAQIFDDLAARHLAARHLAARPTRSSEPPTPPPSP